MLVLAGLAQPAGAQQEIVGILHVDVSGVSETAAAKFEDSLEDGLGNAGFRVAKRKKMRALLEKGNYQDGCWFGPCLERVHAITGVRLVLVARITGVGRNFSYVVTLLDARTGLPTSQATDQCAVCTVDEAIATASIAVIGLVTGAGDATVTDVEDPARQDEIDLADLEQRERYLAEDRASRRKSLRRGTLFLISAAAIAAGVSAYALSEDDKELGYGAAAASGAFAFSGVTLFVISRKF